MLNYLSKYFTLNRRERNGIFILITLLFVLILIKYLVVYHYPNRHTPVAVIELDEAVAKLAQQNIASANENKTASESAKNHSLFYFDPNKITAEQAMQLGFENKCAHMLVNYRTKGGKFYKAEDLKKLYCMNEGLYIQLAPYIHIGENKQEEKNSTDKKALTKSLQTITIEINSADSLQWLSLKGIGPGYTHRILKYKSLLGGFTATEQLKEVYGFTDSLYNAIKESLTVNATLIQKLKVNSVDFKTMVHHPYIKYEGTKCIFALKRNKKIKQEDLTGSSCFSREQLAKVLPYLDFE